MKPRYILYARVSSEKQEDNTSLEMQERRMVEYCMKEGFSIIPASSSQIAYREVGSASGKQPREEFSNALQRLCDEEASGMIVFDLDRFYRNTAQGIFEYQQHFENTGRRLISLQQSIDTSTPEGWWMFIQFLAMAEYISKKDSRKMRDGYNAAKAKDPEKYMGGKLGYGQALEDGKVVEVESPVLDFVRFGMSNGWSVARITQELNWRGYKPLHGLKFYRSTVSAVVGRIQRGENVCCEQK